MRVLGQPIEREYSLAELLRRPDVTYATLMTLPGAGAPVADADGRRAGRDRDQVRRATSTASSDEIARQRAQEDTAPAGRPRLPRACADCRPRCSRSSTCTSRKRSGRRRASPGVTPAAISLLLVHLKRGGDALRARRRAAPRTSQRAAASRMTALAARTTRSTRGRAPTLGRRALPPARARAQLAALSRAAREVEPHVQPDGDPRAGADGHASRARRARRAAAPAAAARDCACSTSAAAAACPASRSRSRVRTGTSSLLDSSHKKGAFLRRRRSSSRSPTSRSRATRVEDYAPAAPFDVVISRAFSDLAAFVAVARAPCSRPAACSSR